MLFKRDPRGRKPKDQAGGVFKTAIDRRCDGVTINAFWRHSRVKQYLKDGRALRVETVVNSPDDLGCQRRICNLPELQARARAVNARLLHTEKVGQGCVFDSPAFARISQPSVTQDGRRAQDYGSATLEHRHWPAPSPRARVVPARHRAILIPTEGGAHEPRSVQILSVGGVDGELDRCSLGKGTEEKCRRPM